VDVNKPATFQYFPPVTGFPAVAGVPAIVSFPVADIGLVFSNVHKFADIYLVQVSLWLMALLLLRAYVLCLASLGLLVLLAWQNNYTKINIDHLSTF